MIVSLLLIGGYFILNRSMSIPSLFLLVIFLVLYFLLCCLYLCCGLGASFGNCILLKLEDWPCLLQVFALWVGTYLIGQLTPWMLLTLTPSGTFLPVCGHVCTLHINNMEISSGNNR